MNNTTEQIQVQYVNQRNGNRPASIKTHDGRYFTVSDAAIGMFQQDASGMISYYQKPGNNGNTYNIATHWNGQELPKDGRNTGYPQMNVPQNPQQNNAPRANSGGGTNKDRLIVLQTIVKACASQTGSTQDADMWLQWITDRMKGNAPQQQPQQQNNAFGNNANAAPPEPGLNDEVPF